MFSKLKNVLSEIHFLLTPYREHGKVFEKVPMIGFKRAKSLKDILVRAKVAPLEKKKGCCRSCGGTRCEICKHVGTTETLRSFNIPVADHVEELGAKYANMLWLLKHWDLSVLKENITLSPTTWTVALEIMCIFFHAKHVQNSTQAVLNFSI